LNLTEQCLLVSHTTAVLFSSVRTKSRGYRFFGGTATSSVRWGCLYLTTPFVLVSCACGCSSAANKSDDNEQTMRRPMRRRAAGVIHKPVPFLRTRTIPCSGGREAIIGDVAFLFETPSGSNSRFGDENVAHR